MVSIKIKSNIGLPNLIPFSKVLTSNSEIDRVQDKIAASVNGLSAIPILTGYLIEDIHLSAGTNIIQHKLDRELRGYIVVKNNVDQAYWDSQSTNSIPRATLVLNCAADATISIWCF